MTQPQTIWNKCRHIVLAFVLLATATACGNDADPGDIRFLAVSTPAREHALVQSELASLYILVNHAVQQRPDYGNGLSGYIPSCATMRWDTTAGKRELSIILPDTGCLCVDGVTRRGQIVIDLRQGWRGTGAQASVSLSSYQAGNLFIDGSFTMKAVGSANVNYEHTVTTSFSKIIILGQQLSWNGTYAVTQVLGKGTVSFFDDDFRFVGTASGESSSRKAFSVKPSSSGIADYAVTSCRNFVQGESTVTTDEFTMKLSYDTRGLGECDDNAYADVGPNDKGNFVIR